MLSCYLSGHATLTLLLLEKMLSNGPGRIVNVIRCGGDALHTPQYADVSEALRRLPAIN
jgi:short-subunit dehydrogenase